MPIRPANLATMSATIAGAIRPSLGADSASESSFGRVTVTFESGFRQVIEGEGTTELTGGHGGIVELEAGARTDYSLYADTACNAAKRLRKGNGPARFLAPINAAAIVLG